MDHSIANMLKLEEDVCGYLEANLEELIQILQTDEWHNFLKSFVDQECEKSVNFKFWWQYMDMVSTLLMFTRAQREGPWDLYLTSFRKMIPFFFQYDHQNYARWSVIYYTQMNHLPDEIKKEFFDGNFVVQGSNLKFSQVDPDHSQ